MEPNTTPFCIGGTRNNNKSYLKPICAISARIVLAEKKHFIKIQKENYLSHWAEIHFFGRIIRVQKENHHLTPALLPGSAREMYL